MASLPTLPTGEGWIWSPEFMGVFQKIKIRERKTFHPDREKIGDKFEMPRLDSIDIESFISSFKKGIANPVGKSEKKKQDTGEKLHNFVEEKRTEAIIQMKNEYESKLIEKDLVIREYEKKFNEIKRIMGDSKEPGYSAPVQNNLVDLWKGKLGATSLATRILSFLSENYPNGFSREQVALALGVARNAGHTSNEWSRLMRTNTVVKDGNVYKLNQGL